MLVMADGVRPSCTLKAAVSFELFAQSFGSCLTVRGFSLKDIRVAYE
jgi:hypothetical protein